MALTERQKSILLYAVHEYIKHAEPVSSQSLRERYRLDISPATLRSELNDLEEQGYLLQPHTSSGRVPMDKGYRFFVDALMERETREKERMRDILAQIMRMKREQDARFAELARAIASFSRSAVFSGSLGARTFFKTGLDEVLSQPEFGDYDVRRHFGRVLDSFEENFSAFSEILKDRNPAVFIGRENPIDSARDFSMIVSKYSVPSGDRIVVIFGPKRMDYERNLSALAALERLID